jgi:hypothetical protein
MDRAASMLLAGLVLLAGCDGRPGAEPAAAGQTPEQVLAAFFQEELKPCTESAECTTGHCDLTPVYTISVSAGYCLSFPNAFDRWQRVELAERLARRAAAEPALMAVLLARLENELTLATRPGEKETLYLILGALRTAPAATLLRRAFETEQGALREVAGLALAEAGDAAGADVVVEAAFSPVVRVRMHAARAAGGLCSETAVGVLAELLNDDHPLVSEAAATALGGCPGEKAAALLRTGEGFAVESARR